MRRKVLTLLSVLAVLFAAPRLAQAQRPTPERTKIINSATVSFTDVNGNTYTPVTAVDTVIVGFKGSLDVTGQSYTPGTPSQGNFALFPIINNGNGMDTVAVSTTPGTGITITGYKINGAATIYTSLANLNTALLAAPIDTLKADTITVIYDVAASQGATSLALTATSNRDAATDTYSSTITPAAATNAVAVTATPTTATLVKTNGTPYTASFDVYNNGNANLTYNLSAVAGGTGTSIVSVNGGTSSILITAGATVSINVTYNLAAGSDGTQGTVALTATQQGNGTNTATGTLTVTLASAALSLSKTAWRDNAGTISATAITTADQVLPGETIWYKLTVTNTGTAPAQGLSITDVLPSDVTYVSNVPAANWTVNEVTGTITATRTGSLAPTASEVILIKVTVK